MTDHPLREHLVSQLFIGMTINKKHFSSNKEQIGIKQIAIKQMLSTIPVHCLLACGLLVPRAFWSFGPLALGPLVRWSFVPLVLWSLVVWVRLRSPSPLALPISSLLNHCPTFAPLALRAGILVPSRGPFVSSSARRCFLTWPMSESLFLMAKQVFRGWLNFFDTLPCS